MSNKPHVSCRVIGIRNRCSTPRHSSFFLVWRQWSKERLLDTYVSMSHSHLPSATPPPSPDGWLHALHHGPVTRSDWSFPSYYTLLPTYKSISHWGRSSERRCARWSKDVEPHLLCNGLLGYLLHDVIQTIPKGRYYESLGWNIQYGGFVLHWLFKYYYFPVQRFATSLKMAVSNRVDSTSTLPSYQSPRRHDSKNTTLYIPALNSIFCCFL